MAHLGRYMPLLPTLDLQKSATARDIGLAPWAIAKYVVAAAATSGFLLRRRKGGDLIMIIPPGATSVSVDVQFLDDTGAAITGKVAADFPACKWSSGTNTADTTITLSDLAAITTAHPNDNTAGGVKEREGGWYRLDLPNNVVTSAGRKTLTFAETTNKRIVAPFVDCQYVQGDLQTIKTQTVTCAAGVTVGAFVGNATAALSVDASGRVDIGKLLGTAWLTPAVAGTPDVNTKTITTDAITSAALATSGVQEIRDAITGYSGSLNVDSGGNVKISDGTGANQLDTISGGVDLQTIKTQAVTCAAGVTIRAHVGMAAAPGVTNGAPLLGDNSAASSITWPATTNASTTTYSGIVNYNATTNFNGQVNYGGGADYVFLNADLVIGGVSSTAFTSTLAGRIDAAITSRLAPTVAGRTLDVSVGGESGIDWANIGSPTTAVNLSGTTIGASSLVNTLTNLPTIPADWLTAAGLATSAVNEIRDAITGYSGAFNLDSGGNVKVSDGTGANQIDTTGGAVAHVILADTVTVVTNQVTTAQILAQMETALSSTTRTMPGQATPSTTPALTDAIMQLFQLATNPYTQSSTLQSLFNRAGTVLQQKRTVSDDGTTFSLGALVTGP